jgi:protein phosphatase 1 regulatory subunit 10
VFFLIVLRNAAIKDMASNVERKWRQLVAGVNEAEGESRQSVAPNIRPLMIICAIDVRPKKRKFSETAPSRPAAPIKKTAIGTASSMKPVVKKETKPVLSAVKDAKSDVSFFSDRPKPKLPSFKKGAPPAQVKKEPGTNVAQPSSVDPFQEVLKSMTRARKDSPAVSTPPSTSTPPQPGIAKNGKKKKSVTWAPENQLESIRLIEKAIYDDDPVDVSCSFLFAAFVLYINAFPMRFCGYSLHRVYIHRTVTANWIEEKEMHYMHIYLKKRLTGLNPSVSKHQSSTPISPERP